MDKGVGIMTKLKTLRENPERKVTFKFDEHLDDLGYKKITELKGKMTKTEYRQRVYDVGLKILDKEHLELIPFHVVPRKSTGSAKVINQDIFKI